MKIITILGSPRKKGNTAEVLGRFEKMIGKDHEVDRINIKSVDVNGCLGCRKCQEVSDRPGCVQKDDAVSIFERMMEADAVVYASPLYCWGFSSQMKALIDRHFCLVTGYGTDKHTSLLEGKRTALLVTCAGPVENNANLIQDLFVRVNKWDKCSVVGKYIVPFCKTPDAIGDNGVDIAKKMVEDIIA